MEHGGRASKTTPASSSGKCRTMTRLDYQKLYDAEFENRERLRSALGIPIALLTLLGGILGTMVPTIGADGTFLRSCFIFGFTCAACFFVVAVYSLIRAYHGYEYEGVPTLLDLRQYHAVLTKHFSDHGAAGTLADVAFSDYLEGALAAATGKNATINATKTAFLWWANNTVILCGVCTALAFIPHAYLKNGMPTPIYRVEVVAPPGFQATNGVKYGSHVQDR